MSALTPDEARFVRDIRETINEVATARNDRAERQMIRELLILRGARWPGSQDHAERLVRIYYDPVRWR